MVPALHVLVEREVLFDDTGSQCNRRKRNGSAQAVVTEPHRNIECLSQRLHVPQMNRFVFRRIDGYTVQQHQLLIALAADRLHGLLYLRHGRHAGGNDHRLLLARHVPQQRWIHEIHGSYLEKRHSQIGEQIDFRIRKRR